MKAEGIWFLEEGELNVKRPSWWEPAGSLLQPSGGKGKMQRCVHKRKQNASSREC